MSKPIIVDIDYLMDEHTSEDGSYKWASGYKITVDGEVIATLQPQAQAEHMTFYEDDIVAALVAYYTGKDAVSFQNVGDERHVWKGRDIDVRSAD